MGSLKHIHKAWQSFCHLAEHPENDDYVKKRERREDRRKKGKANLGSRKDVRQKGFVAFDRVS